jgi:hypothetical protein
MFMHTCVEHRESKTDEAVCVGVLDEGLGNCVGELDGLVLDLDTTNVDNVSTHGTSSTRAVTVGDGELGALQFLEGRRFGGVEGGVLANGGLGKVGREHPSDVMLGCGVHIKIG